MNEIKTLQVIGSGGAFDAETNSSFLLTTTDAVSVLIDCGYNVFEELRRLEKKDSKIISNIKSIIITHMDDDHMGSLKTLIYYRYFVLGITTAVSGPGEVHEYINTINHEMKGSTVEEAEIVTPSPNYYNLLGGISVRFIKVKHHIETLGVIIHDHKNIVCISGDTKATEDLYTTYLRVFNSMLQQRHRPINSLVFHDFSYWNAVSRQVHACRNDCVSEYPIEFLEKTIIYHNPRAKLKGNIYTFKEFELVGNETTLAQACDLYENT